MDSSAEPSSSVSFTSSSHLSNGSTINTHTNPEKAELNLERISLNKLSSNLGQLLCESPDGDFTDAEIVVEENTVGVHRCILAARSKFFRDLFTNERGFGGKNGRPSYYMANFLPCGSIGYDAFVLFLNYSYTGKLNQSPVEVSTCVDSSCTHDSCGPAVNFAVELMYASTIFQVPELVSLFQELPPAVATEVKLLRQNSSPPHPEQDNDRVNSASKSVRRILRALDSDDIELVRLLLTESDTTLDEAYALHYAAAYCDPKVVSEILSLGLADVNLRNARGLTVLHVAARRREPSVIVSLLNKGACASELTFEGRTAVDIYRRLTRRKDFETRREKGQEANNKDRMCVDLLEREMRRNPVVGEKSVSPLAVADDLRMKLLYLEDRVAFARMFFPTEAKLAMEIAHAETTTEVTSLLYSRGSSGNLMEVDLNETPITQNKKLLSRIGTLSRTVELGRRYFPNCSQVLDKFMEDDLSYLEKGTPEEQKMKRKRFMELKDEVNKAFNKDKAKLHRSGFSSSMASFKDPSSYKVKKLREN
ncbi:NPR1-1 protein [Striga asiatica]|uniref:NPR1-1 protein n=1 Tax=Striga asiatica TaxID=4170 RepID=A0A5A7QX78_STRAF|nr:NPR1-1 protein [Striga asiatica]